MFRPSHLDMFGRPLTKTCDGFDYSKLQNPQFKLAVLKTCPCVVRIVSHGVPAETPKLDYMGQPLYRRDFVFTGSGTIIDCNQNASHNDKFSATILTTAMLFYRPNGVQPSDIEVDVYLPSSEICKGKVLACDFHYNLALVNIQLDDAIQPPKLRDLDDTFSIQPTTNHSHSDDFQLYRHSTSFKIHPGDYAAALVRNCSYEIAVALCRFSGSTLSHDCCELCAFSTEHPLFQNNTGGPVINSHGEVIGILALEKTFLPSNLVSRWWNSYKNCMEFRRPWLGLDVTNLQSADFIFLERFLRTFPTVSSGIIVQEVVENSPAHSSGLLVEDVIVQCNGAAVGSTLDFFDKIWGRVGESVELSIIRGAGHFLNIKVTVGEPTRKDFNRWTMPRRETVYVPDSSDCKSSSDFSDQESSSDSEDSLGNNHQQPIQPRSRRPFVRSFPFHLQFFIRCRSGKRLRSGQQAKKSGA